MTDVFIHGSSGTTGLRLRERLEAREDLRLVILPDSERHDPKRVKEALNSAPISFLCLPDDAAREAVAMVENPDAVILDTSTAHRTSPGWAYGFPELSQARRDEICKSRRIAVPGCHASGFVALVAPLVGAGLLSPKARLSCFSLTGYSGGGKKMIAQYQDPNRPAELSAPRQYALGQQHKHLREMAAVSGLEAPPVFCPIVADFYSGMEVTVPLFAADLRPGADMETVKAVYRELYRDGLVCYNEAPEEGGFLTAQALSGLDAMEIAVYGNEERLLLTARFDNLGKGASGAAVECMNLVLGLDPATGLETAPPKG